MTDIDSTKENKCKTCKYGDVYGGGPNCLKCCFKIAKGDQFLYWEPKEPKPNG